MSDDMEEEGVIMYDASQDVQQDVQQGLFGYKTLLIAVCIVGVLLLVCIVYKKSNEGYQEYPTYNNEPDYPAPSHKDITDIKPEELVALWDDMSVVKDFEMANSKKTYEKRETAIKEAPEEDLLWAHVHNLP